MSTVLNVKVEVGGHVYMNMSLVSNYIVGASNIETK